jgi:hypothetical protein
MGKLMNWGELIQRPIHHALIAAYPILFLLSNNLGEVDPREALLPTVAAAGLAVILFLLLRLARVSALRAALLVSILAVVVLLYGHLAAAVGPGIYGLPLLFGWLVAWTVAAFLVLVIQADLRRMTALLNVVSALLVGLALTTIGWHLITEPALYVGGQRVEASAPPAPSGAPRRDVYYLIVEDHGAPRTLSQYLDVPDDDGFYDWLADQGFDLLRETRSNYGRTPLSMASSMNMTYLDELAAAMGPDEASHRPLDQMVRESEATAFLKARGYSYVLLGSQYYLTARSPAADVNPTFAQTSDFMGVLTESTILPAIANVLGFEDELTDRRRNYDAAAWDLRTFPQLADLPGPKFVFMHLVLPHAPWVVDDAGRYVTEEADEQRSFTERYRAQWSFVHREMKSLIQGLLEGPEESRPIIILTTDEGPNPRDMPETENNIDWASATDAQLDQKFAIFAAYYLPGVSDTCTYAGMSSVNTFRLVFDLYFDAKLPLLADRNYIHRDRRHPYDLTEVTDRLPGSSAGSATPTSCGS